MNRTLSLYQVFHVLIWCLPAVSSHADTNIQLMAYHCYSCHGNQLSNLTSTPSLSSEVYLTEKLLTFKYGQTNATIMPRLVKGYHDTELKKLSHLIMRQANVH